MGSAVQQASIYVWTIGSALVESLMKVFGVFVDV